MLVYKNGSTARKYVKDNINNNDHDWAKFNEGVRRTSPGNNESISFFYLVKKCFFK